MGGDSVLRLYDFNPILGIPDFGKPTKLAKLLKSYPRSHWLYVRGRKISQIAYDLYGNSEWWVYLAFFNDIADPYDLPDTLYFLPAAELSSLVNSGRF